MLSGVNQRGFWGDEREGTLSLKTVKQAHVAYFIYIIILRLNLSSLLANWETGGGLGSGGDVVQGKWVSRLRDRGQLSIQFPRLCPLSELPTDTVPVCSNFAELPSLVRTQSSNPRVCRNSSFSTPCLSMPLSCDPPRTQL